MSSYQECHLPVSNNVVPAISCRQDYHLSVSKDVAPAIGSHHHASQTGPWRGMFNIMAWIYSPTTISGSLSLVLYYRDDLGEHELNIDQCKVFKKSNILLTNKVPLTIYGTLIYAKLDVIGHTDQHSESSILEYRVKPVSVSAGEYLQKKT